MQGHPAQGMDVAEALVNLFQDDNRFFGFHRLYPHKYRVSSP
jgi:hypothetical protein